MLFRAVTVPVSASKAHNICIATNPRWKGDYYRILKLFLQAMKRDRDACPKGSVGLMKNCSEDSAHAHIAQ
jgi:hypothetical protein